MMTDEDQELFLEMLLKLDDTHESIKAASKWCRANAASHEAIVRMWFFAVAKAASQSRRLHLFHLTSDILFTAEPSSVQYFSSFLPQLYKAIPFVRGEEIRNDMKKLFALWRSKNIYNKAVMDRLEKLFRNRNKVVDGAIFKYDKELLFKNLKRVEDLRPACDYLARGVEHAPSFDNSQMLLGTIKERKACQSLLSSVDSHKAKVTSLVSYMEEMVHLLKMATTALDLAGNKEHNCVEETRIRILAYGKYKDKVLGFLSSLEKTWDISKADYAKPFTPASPEPEEDSLYSRRIGTVGVPGDPRLANVIQPPVLIPTSMPSVAAPSAPPVVPTPSEDVFHRRDRGLALRREELWSPLLQDDLPFTNPRPPLPRDDLPFSSPRQTMARDELPFRSPRQPLSRDESSFASPRPSRDDLPFLSPRPHLSRDDLTYGSTRSKEESLWESRRLSVPREEPWDTPRPHVTRDEPWESPRPHVSRDDPWESPRPGPSPNVDRHSWSPASPSYSGSPSWGPPLKKPGPVYMPCYTGFHLDNPGASDDPQPPNKRPSSGFSKPLFGKLADPQVRPSTHLGTARPKTLLPTPPPSSKVLLSNPSRVTAFLPGGAPRTVRPTHPPKRTGSPLPSLLSIKPRLTFNHKRNT